MQLKDDWKTKFEVIPQEITPNEIGNIETHTQGEAIGRELKQYLLKQMKKQTKPLRKE